MTAFTRFGRQEWSTGHVITGLTLRWSTPSRRSSITAPSRGTEIAISAPSMREGSVVESAPGEGFGRLLQRCRILCLAVTMVCSAGTLYLQRNSLSLRTAPVFVAGLLALLAAGEVTVRILDRRSTRDGQAGRGAVTGERVGALLDSLSGGGVVLHDIPTGHGQIDYLVFRPEGVVFLIETQPHQGSVAEAGGVLTLNGQPLPNHFFQQARRKFDWLRDFLRAQLRCDACVKAALVFSSASVAAGYASQEVALLGLEHLQPWMDTAEPNDEFSKRLWPRMEQVQSQLLAAPGKRALGTLVIPVGLVLLLGILWLAVSARSVAKQPEAVDRAGQIAPAGQRVAAPVPQSAPAWVKAIHLEGISGAPPRSLAIINGKTLGAGESASVKVEGRDVNIHCLSIVGESATITIEGIAGTREVRLRDEPWERATEKRTQPNRGD